jgi:hypothetical protein
MLPGEEIIHVLPQNLKLMVKSEIKEPIGMYGGRWSLVFTSLWDRHHANAGRHQSSGMNCQD